MLCLCIFRVQHLLKNDKLELVSYKAVYWQEPDNKYQDTGNAGHYIAVL